LFESSDVSWSELKTFKKQLARAYCWFLTEAGLKVRVLEIFPVRKIRVFIERARLVLAGKTLIIFF